MPQQIVVLSEDVNRGSLLCWLQIYDFEYLLQYFLVFYFYLRLFGLTQASQTQPPELVEELQNIT